MKLICAYLGVLHVMNVDSLLDQSFHQGGITSLCCADKLFFWKLYMSRDVL